MLSFFRKAHSKPAADRTAEYVKLVRKAAQGKLAAADQAALDAVCDELEIAAEGVLYAVDAPTRQPQTVEADVEALQRAARLAPAAAKARELREQARTIVGDLSDHAKQTQIMIDQLTKKRELERSALSDKRWAAETAARDAAEAQQELVNLKRTAWQILGEPDPGAPPLPVNDSEDEIAQWAQRTAAWERKHEKSRFDLPIPATGGIHPGGLSPKHREMQLREWISGVAQSVAAVENEHELART